MDSQDWKDFKNQGKKSKKKRLVSHTEIIENFCKEYDFDLEIINEWHLRIYGNGERIDIFPMKKTYHNLKTKVRGPYYDIYKFLDKTFKVNSYGNNDN